MKMIGMAAALVIMAAGISLPAYAQTLSDAEKASKREELRQFFDAAIVNTEPDAPKQARQQLRFTVTGSTRVGYDSNVDLDNIEDEDGFYQERVGGLLEYDPTGWEFKGRPVTLGVAGNYNYLGYFDRDDMNRQGGSGSPFVRLRLDDRFTLEGGYKFRASHYEDQDDLNYQSHGGRLALSHRIATGLTHKGEFRYEQLDYSDRKQLRPNRTFGDAEREDDRYEAVYGVRYHMGRWTTRVEGSWIWNDSNDQYFDYNDYDDFGLDASVSVRTTERWILTGFGGWRNRSFDSRATIPGSLEVQDDDWYYAGGRVFFALNTWSGFDVTATYSENSSNDTNHEYDDLIVSTGFHLFF